MEEGKREGRERKKREEREGERENWRRSAVARQREGGMEVTMAVCIT